MKKSKTPKKLQKSKSKNLRRKKNQKSNLDLKMDLLLSKDPNTLTYDEKRLIKMYKQLKK